MIPAIALSDVPEGESRAVRLGETDILLCHDEGRVFAIENRCSHLDEPLACGRIRRGWIACPAHGARFDLETGEVLGPPASAPIRIFAVKIMDGMIHVAV